MLKRFAAIGFVLLVLPGCTALGIGKAADLNPVQRAYVLNQEYQAVATAAGAVVDAKVLNDSQLKLLGKLDAAAYSYVTSAAVQAEKWRDANPDLQPQEVAAFGSVWENARGALAAFGNFLKGT